MISILRIDCMATEVGAPYVEYRILLRAVQHSDALLGGGACPCVWQEFAAPRLASPQAEPRPGWLRRLWRRLGRR